MPGAHLEELLTAVAIVLAAVVPRLGDRWFRLCEARFAALARRPVLAVVVAGLAPLVMRAILLPWFPVPLPFVHDEFSHLLAADTFAHGRLVNPQHPLWVHFVSMHILVRPVYISPYPMGIGLVLATGQVLTGCPWAGVLLSVGLMCGGVCWMLQAWVPARWALVGGLLAGVRFGVTTYWMNGYFGGALPAFGGALVLGALLRIVGHRGRPGPLWWHSTLLAFGLAIIANTRPIEGVFFSLPAAFVVMLRARRTTVVLPVLLVLGVTAAGMAYDFARVTGNPLEAPYAFFRSRFTEVPHFIWQTPRQGLLYPQWSVQRFYHGWEMHQYLTSRTPPVLHRILRVARRYWSFYVGPILTIPLWVAAVFFWRQRRVQFLVLTALSTWLALAGQVFFNPHYAAPAAAVAMVLVTVGLFGLRGWRWGARPVGVGLSRFLAMACVLVLVYRVAEADILWPVVTAPGQTGVPRARVLQRLALEEGRHLVLVRYRPSHNLSDEWVYNEADIDAAKVVWAHELDPTSNAQLLAYFRDRRVWLVEPDVNPPRLSAYVPSTVALPFVPPGTEGIEVLRSVDTLKQRILDSARASGLRDLNCGQWNSLYARTTGYEGPPVEDGCYLGTDRSRAVRFDEWFSWLNRQRGGKSVY
jgi:hypothetical protein